MLQTFASPSISPQFELSKKKRPSAVGPPQNYLKTQERKESYRYAVLPVSLPPPPQTSQSQIDFCGRVSVRLSPEIARTSQQHVVTTGFPADAIFNWPQFRCDASVSPSVSLSVYLSFLAFIFAGFLPVSPSQPSPSLCLCTAARPPRCHSAGLLKPIRGEIGLQDEFQLCLQTERWKASRVAKG